MAEETAHAPDLETVRATQRTRWALLALWSVVILGLYVVQEENFLLFHGLAEVFSIVIAGGVFLVTWNSRKLMNSDFLLVIGIAYAFVAFLDLIHTFAYAGMGVFPEHGANLPTQLWIAARYLEAVSLVVGTTLIGNNLVTARLSFSHRLRGTVALVLGYATVTIALLVTIFTGEFPAAYVEGAGLTPFKIVSEYIIIGLLGIALGLFYRHRTMFDEQVFRYVAIALLLTMGAEFAFTQYVGVYGLSNMIGHLLKIMSFYLIYLAIIKTGISVPQELLFRQLKEERDTLVDREAQLQRQNERLDDFASIVSHDLRNPLNVAQGHTRLLREDCDSEYIEPVDQALARMDDLIEDLLALAREGDTLGDVEPIAFGDIIEDCWQNVATAEATIVTEINRTIQADRSRIQQLLENLLRNAIEHGGKDVTVTIGVVNEGFYVEDNGPGIPEGERDAVLEAGYSTTEAGTGFGLSIVKQIAEAHGWEFSVTESSGGGARFEITSVEFAE